MTNTALLTTLVPFPATGWWVAALDAKAVVLDGRTPFRKMADRNRYRIATAAGAQLLSIPLSGGRGQQAPMEEVRIAGSGWQEQHWRTVFSAYGRAAYFEHYGPQLEALYRDRYELLWSFNRRTVDWAAAALRVSTAHFTENGEAGGEAADWRGTAPAVYEKSIRPGAAYHQVFGDRHGFLSQLSILDLLMNEGPASAGWLRRNGAAEWFP